MDSLSRPAGSLSRQNPSPRYRELLELYCRMHVDGEQVLGLPPEETFQGKSLPDQAIPIKALIEQTGSRSVLDYGSGKGMQYEWRDLTLPDGQKINSIAEFWGVAEITCYDPAYEAYSRIPQGKFDAVICTDVLEHCPEEDMPWILEEIFSLGRRFVYANIACYPANKTLPNGENAHCTIRPVAWWRSLLDRITLRHPELRYEFLLEIRRRNLIGQKKRENVLLRNDAEDGRFPVSTNSR